MSIIAISGKINNGKDAVGDIINYLTREEVYKELSFDEYQEELIVFQPYKTKKFADKLKDTVCLWLGCTRKQLEDRDFKEKELGEEWWCYKTPDGLVDYKSYEATRPLVHFESVVELIKLTPRKLLQLVGTEGGRDLIHPNIWVNATMGEYKPHIDAPIHVPESEHYLWTKYPNWLITDCRFPNEADTVNKQQGGVTIRVNRPVEDRFPELYRHFIHDLESIPHILATKPTEGEFMRWLMAIDPEMYDKLMHSSETSLDNYKDFTHTINNDGTFGELIEKVKKILVSEEII